MLGENRKFAHPESHRIVYGCVLFRSLWLLYQKKAPVTPNETDFVRHPNQRSRAKRTANKSFMQRSPALPRGPPCLCP